MRRPPVPVLILSILSMALVPGRASGAAPDRAAEELDRRIDAVTDGDSPGMAVIVAREGRVIYSRAEGVTSLESRRPVRLDTPFYVASVSKAFTATGLLMLAEEGRLSLDDPLSRYFQGLPPWSGKVTLRRMLSHTSGLPDHYDILGGEEKAAGLTNAAVLEMMRKQESLLFEPGEKWSYSNSAYVLLAGVIEKVSGKPLRAFLEERIFHPLGMTNTSVHDGSASKPEGCALGYEPSGEGFVPSDYRQTTTGAGGVYSTARDLLEFARALESGRLLHPETMGEAVSVARLSDGRPTPYGLGWQVEDFVDGPLKGELYVAQFGMLRGFRAVLFRAPSAGLTYIMLSSGGRGPGFPSEIASLFAVEDGDG